MKRFIHILIFLICTTFCHAQQHTIDSLNRVIPKATSDSQKINLMYHKAHAFWDVNFDSCIQLYNKVLQECQSVYYKRIELLATIDLAGTYISKGDTIMAKKNLDKADELFKVIKNSTALYNYYWGYGNLYSIEGKFDSSIIFYKKAIVVFPSASATMYACIGGVYNQIADFPDALIYYQKALLNAEKANDEYEEADTYGDMSSVLYRMEDFAKAEQYSLDAIRLEKKIGVKSLEGSDYESLSLVYFRMHRYKEAYTYGMKSAGLEKIFDYEAFGLSDAARALAGLNKFNEAEKLNREAIVIADSSKVTWSICKAYAAMGDILKMEGKDKEAIPYYEKFSKTVIGSDLYNPDMADIYTSLSECYEKVADYNKALGAYKTAIRINDTLKNMENIRKATELDASYEYKKKQEMAKAIQDKKDADTKRKRTQQYFIIAGLAVVVLAFVAIALIQLRNNKQKQKANALLQHQKKEIEHQKEKVENTLTELKSTQAQLIQSEKMASLGELTAGIAHEIQNPLNFVNNFSEVNDELIEELNNESDIAEIKAIANDIKQNNEKINHHGKRADAIVKGMLQHSRQSSGKKEPTDINALCDEYLRLSYHGLRAKDKNFTADFKTDFDESIGKINIVPQDIGRVLLNLFNNAFYATNENKKTADTSYQSTVSIQIKKINDKVEIRVEDNGNGIPQNIIDKIFQPFFTTKPTGQGTGLGLSLAYDIITKEHNGTIKVESKEAEGTIFIITLPVA